LDDTRLGSLRVQSATEFLSSTSKEVNWIWKPFLPAGGLVIVSAYMKVGKSTMIYALSKAIACGEDFLGFSTRRCPVLILGVEEHATDMAIRLRTFGVKAGDPVYIHSGPINPDAITYAVLQQVVRDLNIGLVVVDTLSRWWRIEDENDNAEVLRAVSPLLQLARSSGACVLLVHHSGKMEADGGRAIRGASSLFGIVDQALLLRKPINSTSRTTERVIETFGRYDATPRELHLDWDEITKAYRVVGAPGPSGLPKA
jgi:RecA-family ATPase